MTEPTPAGPHVSVPVTIRTGPYKYGPPLPPFASTLSPTNANPPPIPLLISNRPPLKPPSPPHPPTTPTGRQATRRHHPRPMDSSGSASSYKLQLALAVLVGASSTAAAAYYLHCRAVAQVGGDLARSASSRRRRPRPPAGASGGKPPPPRRAAAGSASLPDLSAFYDVGGRGGGGLAAGGYLVEEEEEEGLVGPHANGGALDSADFLQIPEGLPRLHVGPDGMFVPHLWTRVDVCGWAGCVLEWSG